MVNRCQCRRIPSSSRSKNLTQAKGGLERATLVISSSSGVLDVRGIPLRVFVTEAIADKVAATKRGALIEACGRSQSTCLATLLMRWSPYLRLE